MTRKEHIQWCKKRAHEYVGAGDLDQAVTSMLSDLGKHDETRGLLDFAGGLGLMTLMSPTRDSVVKFIEGFAE